MFYIAVILYESSSNNPDYKALYEECFTLIEAGALEEAREKAEIYAKNNEHSYQNMYGETITWLTKEIVDVNRVLFDRFQDSTELYARHFRNYEAYRAFEPLLSGEEL